MAIFTAQLLSRWTHPQTTHLRRRAPPGTDKPGWTRGTV